jgi:protein O-mannosyl-transferase
MDQGAADSSWRANLRRQLFALRDKQWPRYLFLAAIGFLVHLPALQGQPVWDDDYLAHENPFIKSPLLAFEAFRHYLFLDSYSPHYRPVQNLSFMADYYFWNTDPTGFHLTNVLLHVASGLLLYRLLILLFRKGAGIWSNTDPKSKFTASVGAFLITALWIVHPVHSAAVDYISGRADSLAFLFAAGGWLLVLRARGEASVTPANPGPEQATSPPIGRTRPVASLPLQGKQPRWLRFALYLCAAFFALLALCSREVACVWILLFLIHTLVFANGIRRKTKIVTVICCVCVLAIYAGLHQLPGGRAEKGGSENWGAPIRATLMLRALGDYGRLMVFPADLHMERTIFEPNNYRTRQSWRDSANSEYLSILGLCVLAAFAYGCAKAGVGQRTRVVGAIWFFSAYLPISNIVLLNATVAEHWLYLPSVGFLIFLAGCAFDLPRSFQRPLAGVAAIAVVALGVRSTVRSTDWCDPETFYQRTLAAGGSGARVEVNLGLIYGRHGDYAEAEKLFRHVLALTPNYPIARTNLADVLSRQGKLTEAEALLTSGAKIAPLESKDYPRTWMGIYNLASFRHNAHDDAGAIALLDHARLNYPQVWELISCESELVRRTQGPLAALDLVQDFVRKNWWHHAARLAEGRLYAEKGDTVLAIQALRYAAMLDVHDVEALRLIATMKMHENRLDEAFQAQRRAVARQPDQPSQYLLLSDILEKMGRSSEARAARAKVSQLQALAMESGRG